MLEMPDILYCIVLIYCSPCITHMQCIDCTDQNGRTEDYDRESSRGRHLFVRVFYRKVLQDIDNFSSSEKRFKHIYLLRVFHNSIVIGSLY